MTPPYAAARGNAASNQEPSSTAPPAALPRQNSHNTAQKRRIWGVLSALGELFRAYTTKHGDIETNNTTAHPQQGTTETDDTSAPENCTRISHFSPAKAMVVSVEAQPARAKATGASHHRATWPTGPGCGTRGRRRGLAGQRADAPIRTSAHQAPLVWRAPEGPEGLAAVPVGDGAWPDFETTRRAKLAARTARGRAAATGTHSSPARRTARPAPGTPAAPQPQTQKSGPEPLGSGPPSMLSGDQQCTTRISSARPPCHPCRSSRR